MARVKTQKARKKYSCSKCKAAIMPGDDYRKVVLKTGPRSSRTIIRCIAPKCALRPSELTSSDTLITAYGIREGLEDAIASENTTGKRTQ